MSRRMVKVKQKYQEKGTFLQKKERKLLMN